MNLTYNSLTFQICHFTRFDVDAVYSDDGIDYLYHHIVIGVEAIFNPSATTDPTQGQGLVGQPKTVQQTPLSLKSLRPTMMAAQKKLTFTMGVGNNAVNVLQFPLLIGGGNAQPTVDANNGPRPIDFQVIEFHGVKSAKCHFDIECWERLDQSPTSAIISNRWQQTEDVSEDYLTTLHTEGTCYFRTDLLQSSPAELKYTDSSAPLTADWRAVYMLPIPDGFQRFNIRVTAASDANSVDYSFDDVEQIWSLKQQYGIIRVSGRTGYSWGLPSPFSLPRSMGYIEAEVWGRRTTKRDQIANALLQVLTAGASQLRQLMPSRGVAGVNFSFAGSDGKVDIDFPQRHGKISLSLHRSGLIGGLAAMGDAQLGQATSVFKEMKSPLWTTQRGPCIMPAGSGRRGDAMVSLMTAALANGVAPASAGSQVSTVFGQAKPPTWGADIQ